MRPSAAWDIWDKVWRAKKEMSSNRGGITYPVCFFLLSETVAPKLLLLKYIYIYMMQGDVTRKLVSSQEAQFPRRLFYFDYPKID